MTALRTRKEPTANYSAFFNGRMTIRSPIDCTRPITELCYPEFYDVCLGSKCSGGCPECAMSATPKGRYYTDPAGKIRESWGPMPLEQRPFQVAIGGGGEPTEHSQLATVLRTFRELSIVPNYTTNGVRWHAHGLMKATREYCGGVAISCHRHLDNDWQRAVTEYRNAGVSLNLHVIIGGASTSKRFHEIYEYYHKLVDYIVLLPMLQIGRGIKTAPPDHEALLYYLGGKSWSKLAFGSGFWDWLTTRPEIPAVLYPPEIMSKYVLLDTPVRVYNNSHEMRELLVVKSGVIPPMPL